LTVLHAKVDVLEGELPRELVGGADRLARRSFVVLTLMRDDGTMGVGEASPLPGYSPDDVETAASALYRLVEDPVEVDPLATPFEIVSAALGSRPIDEPSARFAIETAVLDWLGHNRGAPVHRVLGGDADPAPIPIGDLMMSPDAADWPRETSGLVADGATHIKYKVGRDFASEVSALETIRAAHPDLPIRLDGNRRLSVPELRAHDSALQALELELFEEPVGPTEWSEALEQGLPWALDETLLDSEASRRHLDTGRVQAVVLKPTLLGGFTACLAWAERAAAAGADFTVSHTFDGPIARAATAELGLALQCRLAAGLGQHPALSLWPPVGDPAIEGRRIVAHDAPGLGLSFEDEDDA
jgi:L-alanine-DL-glutamate epimerase-like enolase superfamily enzyme